MRSRRLLAGYLAALLAIGWTIGSILSATWQAGGARRGILGGPMLCLVGLVLLAFLMPMQSAGAAGVLLPICAGLLCVGLGIGFTWPHLVTGILKAAPPSEHELATAAIATVQLSAAALGAAAAGVVANLAGIAQPGGVAGASSAAAWLFGMFALAPVLCIVAARRTWERQEDATRRRSVIPAATSTRDRLYSALAAGPRRALCALVAASRRTRCRRSRG